MREARTPHYRDLSDEALDDYIEGLEIERAAADPWLLPAVDQRRIAALGDAFHRTYHVLDQADLPEETEDEKLTPTPLHTALCVGLQAGLELRYHGRDDVLAVQELGLYYDSVSDMRAGRAAPDLSVVFGASPRGRRSYVFWRERKAPAFAMEVLSPSTWQRDVGLKRDIYAKLGIRDYVIFDPDDHITPRLQGFALRDGAYQPVPAKALPGGMVGVWSEALGLYVCHEEPWPESGWRTDGEVGKLRWYDPAERRYLETPKETAQRADQEQRRADQAQERVDQEQERADQEQERADAAEARVAELMARLQSLTGKR